MRSRRRPWTAPGPGAESADFYRGKVAAAKWFAQQYLPGVTAEKKKAEAVNLDVMELPESAF